MKKLRESLGFNILRLSIVIIIGAIFYIFYHIFAGGASELSWEFLTEMPGMGMKGGGILPIIVGTCLVTIVTTIVSTPLGVMTGIYLSEYATDNVLTRAIRLAIRNLSGVPSIVYGLFGLAIFVNFMNFPPSILVSGLTLGFLTLPYVITTTEEALKSIPFEYREGSIALGATKWYTIRRNVLPYAFSGILTGIILALSRAAGETAPILITGVAFYLPDLPGGLMEEFMALPYHIYILSTQHEDIIGMRPIAYASAIVLIGLVLLLNLSAFILRYRARKKIIRG